MARKQKDEAREQKATTPKHRAKKGKEAAPIADPLEAVIAKAGLISGEEVLRPLPPAELTLEPLARHPEPEPAPERPEPPKPHESNGKPLDHDTNVASKSHAAESAAQAPWEGKETKWADHVRPERPKFAPVPQEFMNVDRYETAGLRVNKSRTPGIAAIQFAEDRVPDRQEKNAMEDRGITYSPSTRQWERTDRERPGVNLLDMKAVAKELANTREQIIEVFGR